MAMAMDTAANGLSWGDYLPQEILVSGADIPPLSRQDSLKRKHDSTNTDVSDELKRHSACDECSKWQDHLICANCTHENQENGN